MTSAPYWSKTPSCEGTQLPALSIRLQRGTSLDTRGEKLRRLRMLSLPLYHRMSLRSTPFRPYNVRKTLRQRSRFLLDLYPAQCIAQGVMESVVSVRFCITFSGWGLVARRAPRFAAYSTIVACRCLQMRPLVSSSRRQILWRFRY